MIDDDEKPAMPELTLPAATKTCPNCGKPALPAFKPFCSKRCADVDLARWLKGSYAVPASPDEDDEEERVDPQSGQEQ